MYSQFSDVRFSSVALAARRAQRSGRHGSPLNDDIVEDVLLSAEHGCGVLEASVRDPEEQVVVWVQVDDDGDARPDYARS